MNSVNKESQIRKGELTVRKRTRNGRKKGEDENKWGTNRRRGKGKNQEIRVTTEGSTMFGVSLC